MGNAPSSAVSTNARMQMVLGRGTRTLYEPEISFWRAASKSAAELGRTPDFAEDAARISAWKADIDVVAQCGGSTCDRQGGFFTRRRYMVVRGEYERAFVSLRQPLGPWARVKGWFRAIP